MEFSSYACAILRRIKEKGELIALAIKLAWNASPVSLSGIICLVLIQAILPVLELASAKVVVDRITLDLGNAPSGLARDLQLGKPSSPLARRYR